VEWSLWQRVHGQKRHEARGEEEFYRRNYGITRTELNLRFLSKVGCSARILEVDSNTGNQLLCLQENGFYGAPWHRTGYAVETSKSRTENINIIQGDAHDISFRRQL